MKTLHATLFGFLASVFQVQAQNLNIVTDIAPVHSIVSAITQDHANLDLIVRPGISAHSYVMRPSEAKSLQNADIVIWTGPKNVPWLRAPLSNIAGSATTFDLSQSPGINLLGMRSNHSHADDGHGHEHSHDIEFLDPHIWLDPENALAWIDPIVELLSDQDPEDSTTYRQNGSTLKSELNVLLDEIRGLNTNSGRFAVYHDAYQYIERHVGASAVLSLTDVTGRSAGAAWIRQFSEELKEHDYSCFIAEPDFNRSLGNRLLEGTDTRLVVLDPLGGEFEPGPDLYSSLIRKIASEISNCQ